MGSWWDPGPIELLGDDPAKTCNFWAAGQVSGSV